MINDPGMFEDANIERMVIARFKELGVVIHDDFNYYRI